MGQSLVISPLPITTALAWAPSVVLGNQSDLLTKSPRSEHPFCDLHWSAAGVVFHPTATFSQTMKAHLVTPLLKHTSVFSWPDDKGPCCWWWLDFYLPFFLTKKPSPLPRLRGHKHPTSPASLTELIWCPNSVCPETTFLMLLPFRWSPHPNLQISPKRPLDGAVWGSIPMLPLIAFYRSQWALIIHTTEPTTALFIMFS